METIDSNLWSFCLAETSNLKVEKSKNKKRKEKRKEKQHFFNFFFSSLHVKTFFFFNLPFIFLPSFQLIADSFCYLEISNHAA